MSLNTSLHSNFWLFAFLFSLSLILSGTWYFASQYSYWGDEVRFVETIKYFGQDFQIKKLIQYNEMSAPLPFLLYAGWGKIVGFELSNLRVFSLIIAVITYISFFWFVSRLFHNQKTAYFCTMFIVVHPYMLGFSVFVFTDMLPIFASVMALCATKYSKPMLILLAGITGLLSRQYFVFFLFALGLTFFFRFLSKKSRKDAYMAIAIFISTLPLGIFAYLWGGLSPPTHLNNLYLDEAFRFHPEYLSLYILQLFVYLLPFVLLNAIKIYGRITVWLITIATCWFYFLFPIVPSPAAREASFHTVGFFHRIVRFLVGSSLEHVIFFTMFTISIPIAVFIITDTFQRFRLKCYDLIFALHLSVLCYFLIMPFSYLLWEKYFMPLVPILSISLMAFNKQSKTAVENNIPIISLR